MPAPPAPKPLSRSAGAGRSYLRADAVHRTGHAAPRTRAVATLCQVSADSRATSSAGRTSAMVYRRAPPETFTAVSGMGRCEGQPGRRWTVARPDARPDATDHRGSRPGSGRGEHPVDLFHRLRHALDHAHLDELLHLLDGGELRRDRHPRARGRLLELDPTDDGRHLGVRGARLVRETVLELDQAGLLKVQEAPPAAGLLALG